MEKIISFKKALNNIQSRNTRNKSKSYKVDEELLAIRNGVTRKIMLGINNLPYIVDSRRKRDLVEKRAVVSFILREVFGLEIIYVSLLAFNNNDHSFCSYLVHEVYQLVPKKVVEEVSKEVFDIILNNISETFFIDEYGLVRLQIVHSKLDRVSWTKEEFGDYLYNHLEANCH
jgi:hypothetical protein